MEEESLWRIVVARKYGVEEGGWWTRESSIYRASSVWKRVAQLKTKVWEGIRFVLGDGSKINFWDDSWLEDRPLGEIYPLARRAALRHRMSVFSCYEIASGNIIWAPACRRNLLDDESEEMLRLLNRLVQIKPVVSAPDSLSWKFGRSGVFSVKSFYQVLGGESAGVEVSPISAIWKYGAPSKVAAFAWLAGSKKILTVDNLRKRGMIIPNVCLMCFQDGESVNHLFIHCSFARQLWNKILNVLHLSWVMPEEIEQFFVQWHEGMDPKSVRWFWRIVMLAGIWFLWKERNSRIFRSRAGSVEQVFALVKKNASDWAIASKGVAAVPDFWG